MHNGTDKEIEDAIRILTYKKVDELVGSDLKLSQLQRSYEKKRDDRIQYLWEVAERKARAEVMKSTINDLRMSMSAMGAPTMPSEDTESTRTIRFPNEIRKA